MITLDDVQLRNLDRKMTEFAKEFVGTIDMESASISPIRYEDDGNFEQRVYLCNSNYLMTSLTDMVRDVIGDDSADVIYEYEWIYDDYISLEDKISSELPSKWFVFTDAMDVFLCFSYGDLYEFMTVLEESPHLGRMIDGKSLPTFSRSEVEFLWSEFIKVPIENERIGKDFFKWGKGAPREMIWEWFNINHPLGIDYLLYGKGLSNNE